MRVFLLACLVFLLAACGVVTDDGLIISTADPAWGILIPWAEPEVVPAEEVGEIAPDPTPAPPCEIVKGNISRTGEKIYHVPGGANYDQVKIDSAAGESFFCTEEEAVEAGWRKARQ